MDRAFLWCAVALISRRLASTNSIENTATDFKLVVTKADISCNDYTYVFMHDNHVFTSTYHFENNNFICGTLNITYNSHNTVDKYYLHRSNDTFKVYSGQGKYIEFHIINNFQILAIYVDNGKKTVVDYVYIIQDNSLVDMGFDKLNVSLITIPADKTIVHKLRNKALMPLFAVSGAIDNKCTTCHDVLIFHSGHIIMIIYSDIGGQVIAILERPNSGSFDKGTISVMNSDFNQNYVYMFNNDTGFYEICEQVKSHRNKLVNKRIYQFKESDDYIETDDKKFYINIINHNNVMFSTEQ